MEYGKVAGIDKPVSRIVFGTEQILQRRERARIFAHEHHVTVAQVALAYVLSHPLGVFAVVGCTMHEKLADNARAVSLQLDEAR